MINLILALSSDEKSGRIHRTGMKALRRKHIARLRRAQKQSYPNSIAYLMSYLLWYGTRFESLRRRTQLWQTIKERWYSMMWWCGGQCWHVRVLGRIFVSTNVPEFKYEHRVNTIRLKATLFRKLQAVGTSWDTYAVAWYFVRRKNWCNLCYTTCVYRMSLGQSPYTILEKLQNEAKFLATPQNNTSNARDHQFDCTVLPCSHKIRELSSINL